MDGSSKKRKCKFNDNLAKEFPFLKSINSSDAIIRCTKCNGEFSIAHGGKGDINKHLSTEKHKRTLEEAASTSTTKVTDFFRKQNFETSEKQLSLAEGMFAFHTVKHNQSFRSMDCTSKIIQRLFEKKFACARTKAEAIICNVFSPYACSQLRKELNNSTFISIYSDASNHKDVKLFPTLVRYFDPLDGVKIKIIDFVSLEGETSQIIFDSIKTILDKNEVKDKVIGF